MAKRQCKGETKAGKPCKAAPLHDGEYCSAHDPNLPDETRFGSPVQAGRAGASPKPHRQRVVDVIRERIEEHIDDVLRPLFEALDADRGVVVGSGENAMLEHVPDWDARLRAVREVLDRAYGRPKQALEHTGPEGGALAHEVILDAESREAIAGVLRRRPATRSE